MKWRMRLMRKAGRRIGKSSLTRPPIGTIRTHSCTTATNEPYDVTVLKASDSPSPRG